MTSKSEPISELEAASPASPSVPELISQLRSSFFSSEFENAAKVLTEREEAMTRRSIELEKKAECLANWGSEKKKFEGELRRKQNDLDLLKAECEDAKARVLELEKCNTEVEKNLQDTSKKNQAECDGLRKSNIEFMEKIRVLENEKGDLEAELRANKKKYFELHLRVSNLEKTAEVLMGSDLRREKEAVAESRTRLTGEGGDSSKGVDSSLAKNTRSKPEVIVINGDDNGISDSFLKRKRESSEGKEEHGCDDDEDNMPIICKKRKNPQDLTHLPKASNQSSTPLSVREKPVLEKPEDNKLQSSNGFQSISPSKDILDMYAVIMSHIEEPKEGWQYEADMLKAFNNDDELCMDAVCALHRRNMKRKLSSTGSPFIPGNDASRIQRLGELLIDGHPQQKLKKRAICESDMEDCRKLAHKYSTVLFDIFQKKEDPLFPSSRS